MSTGAEPGVLPHAMPPTGHEAPGTSVFVYFKAPRSSERYLRALLDAFVASRQGPLVHETGFALRADAGTTSAVQTWLEHYRLAPHADVGSFVAALQAAAHTAGIAPPTILGERHCEIFSWHCAPGAHDAGADARPCA